MNKVTKTFSTKQGVVTISDPFFTLMADQPQVEVTYKPNNYCGWGMCKTYNAIEVSDFTQADAELFASTADSKLRIQGKAA
ncbi:hypothetical protein H5202_07820 [Shewanella sp. SG41-4]|uniref:hypothetical protein n=1 Tax=Shewanella sp. SG41-4 TaxID=2760976 RepID=UPI00160221B8|nr:hypothetical protein [Shewanella sp. SG41-4]MBB1438598.1 hypothetical protein [Shewanella sp. SG41-4]|tara:strand:- start:106038 stop:106280 length:243 start_codon:yes stop_codon:yes gene_type:complete